MELSDVAVFVKVIQAGSFTAAAQRLGAPKSTVSSKVSGLERRLGITLLQRTTRTLRLTAEGSAFFQTCARALGEIEAAEALASSGQKTPQGRLSVTAPNDAGPLLASFLQGFLAKYPDLSVDLVLTNRRVDLISEGVDVAIRAGELKDSTLIARKIAKTHRALFASPIYLAKQGVPKHPSELSAHQCVLHGQRQGEWELIKEGQAQRVKVSGVVSADDIVALRELAAQGLGIAMVPTFICGEAMASKSLKLVLPGWISQPSAMSVVYPSAKYQHPKVRAFVEEVSLVLAEVYGAANSLCGVDGPDDSLTS